MQKITFGKEERDAIVRKLQGYFSQELDQELGQFDAEFLLDFFTEEIGPAFYNRALYDAQAVLETRLDDLREAIFEIEQPSEFQR